MNKGPVKSNQSEEDYLESILLLSGKVPFVHRIEVAKRMGVSQAAVNKAVKLLCERNYVYEDGKHLYLTEEGREFLPPRRRKTRAKWNISSAGRLLP